MFFRKKIKRQFMITIPEPCSETWSEMRVVDDCHRHCEACERTLTDFAQMNDDELLLFFKHSQGKICGRFRKDQLNRPLAPIPEKIAKANWWKAAALLPLTLFSKNSSAQQLNPDSTKTEQEAPGITLAGADSVDWVQANDTTVRDWIWHDKIFGPEIITMGGVPMIHDIWNFPPICTTGYTITVDSASSLPQAKAHSALGIDAAAPPVPVKKPTPTGSAGAAWNFQAIVPDADKNK